MKILCFCAREADKEGEFFLKRKKIVRKYWTFSERTAIILDKGKPEKPVSLCIHGGEKEAAVSLNNREGVDGPVL